MTLLVLILILIGLFVSATLTLAKAVFGSLASNFDDSKDNSRDLKAIRKIVDTPPFFEVVSLGRITSNSGVAILGYSFLINIIHLSGLLYIDLFLCVLIIWIALYFIVIFVPSLMGALWPQSLAKVVLYQYRLVAFFLNPPARLARTIHNWTMSSLGYDPKLRFLSEDQREMFQSDTTVSEDDSSLEEDERQMIRNIFDFVETPVREIMTPRVDMLALDIDTPLEEVVQVLNHERHSRVPVYRESMDSIIGVLHNREFLHWFSEHGTEPFELEKIIKPAIFVPNHKKIDDLLKEFRRSGNQLAIVIDEYGGTAGLVTLEDILEEIVGDIRDEDDQDEEEPFVRLKDGKFLVDPLISLSDLEYELDTHIEVPEDSHVETLSGLIHATLGSIPSQGTEISMGYFKVRILKVEGTRMEKVLLTLTP